MIEHNFILQEIFNDLMGKDSETNSTEMLKEEKEVPQVILNGEPIDLSKSENVQKAYDFIDMFAKSPVTKLFMDDDTINNICDVAKKNIEAMHAGLTTNKEVDEVDDDSVELATKYLEETVDNWKDVPVEQKKRSINAITDFIDWLAEHIDEQ